MTNDNGTTARTLLVLRNEIAAMVEAAENARRLFNALAERHDLEKVEGA